MFAYLVLKSFLKTHYRGVVEFLADCESFQQVLNLKRVPHFTTLQKACKKLLSLPVVEQLLLKTLRLEAVKGVRVCRDKPRSS